MQYYKQKFDEERALYGISESEILDCDFDGVQDGESALKETSNNIIKNCYFNLRYPLWHADYTKIFNSKMSASCRAALWYDKGIEIDHCEMKGIKALREYDLVSVKHSKIYSLEFAWKCRNVNIQECTLDSQYPFFECEDVKIHSLHMKGKYSFQYVKNMEIRNSVLDTKDAFWHSENVTVYDSVIQGEYLGWYSKNLKLVRCRIIGTQPLCYCENLVLEDCTMEQTDLAFELSGVHATVLNEIDSIKNPKSGTIKAKGIKQIIFDNKQVCERDTVIKTDV